MNFVVVVVIVLVVCKKTFRVCKQISPFIRTLKSDWYALIWAWSWGCFIASVWAGVINATTCGTHKLLLLKSIILKQNIYFEKEVLFYVPVYIPSLDPFETTHSCYPWFWKTPCHLWIRLEINSYKVHSIVC